VHAAQNQAAHEDNPHNHAQDDYNTQRVELGLLAVIAGNNGVQQVINIAPMNLTYVKLHTHVLAETGPSRTEQTECFPTIPATGN
jgi:hypothetical protein